MSARASATRSERTDRRHSPWSSLNRIYTRTGDEGTTGARDRRAAPETRSARRRLRHRRRDQCLPRPRPPPHRRRRRRRHARRASRTTSSTSAPTSRRRIPTSRSPASRCASSRRRSSGSSARSTSSTPNCRALRSFVLPGGTPAAAALHLARTVCRRAERLIVALARPAGRGRLARRLKYLNRLSDFLFVASRVRQRQGRRRRALGAGPEPLSGARAMFLPLHDGVPLAHLKAPVVDARARSASARARLSRSTAYGPLSTARPDRGRLRPHPGGALRDGGPAARAALRPRLATLVTSLFLHGSLLHLVGNMLFLWVFGDNVEDAMGHVRFLVFFLLCGSRRRPRPCLRRRRIRAAADRRLGRGRRRRRGLSILYPRVRVWGLFLVGIPLRVPACAAIGFWFASSSFRPSSRATTAVGWFAHLGGFVAGAALIAPSCAGATIRCWLAQAASRPQGASRASR